MYRKLERRLSTFYNAKPFWLVSGKPVVSFTFDDVPASSIEKGARILEQYHVSGTFYLSGSLAGKSNLDLPQYKENDIARLMNGGHEIGCHTYEHTDIQPLSISAIEKDLDRNYSFLKQHIGEHGLTSFSYPFGCISLNAKSVVRRRFATGRGINSGLNRGLSDLSQLRANAIYNQSISEEKILELISTNVQHQSWLIFYTHDISNNPTPYGCTPELFEYAVRYAVESGSEILCMRSALARKAFSNPPVTP